MILMVSITKKQRFALLSIYPSVKYLIDKTIKDVADKIIVEGNQSDIEKDIREYHDRQVLNGYDIRGRKMTQETKDKIHKSLKDKYLGCHNLPETNELIGKGNKGKKRTVEQKKNASLLRLGMHYKKRIKVELN